MRGLWPRQRRRVSAKYARQTHRAHRRDGTGKFLQMCVSKAPVLAFGNIRHPVPYTSTPADAKLATAAGAFLATARWTCCILV